MKQKFLLLTLIAGMFTACESPESADSGNEKSGSISFITAITRAVGNQWEVNDMVGVFQVPTGSAFTEAIGKNIAYSTPEGNGNFTSKKPLIYPDNSTTTYDFTAYYPYKESITKTYPVNVSSQAQINKLDLLYARTVGQNKTNTTVNLKFKHCLSNLVVEVKAGKDVASLENLTVTLTGSPTQGVFNLEDGSLSVTGNTIKDIAMKISIGSDKLSAKAEAIVIPSSWTNCTLIFKVPDQGMFIYTFKEGEFLKGKKYKLIATLSKDGTVQGVELEGLNNSIDDWNTNGGDMGSVDENFSGSGSTGPDPEPEPEPDPEPDTGAGSKANPYSVTQLLDYKSLNIKSDVYLQGYVVGLCNYKGESLFAPMTEAAYETFANKTPDQDVAFLIADSPTERTVAKLIFIQGNDKIPDAKEYLIPKFGLSVRILINNQIDNTKYNWKQCAAVSAIAVKKPLTFE